MDTVTAQWQKAGIGVGCNMSYSLCRFMTNLLRHVVMKIVMQSSKSFASHYYESEWAATWLEKCYTKEERYCLQWLFCQRLVVRFFFQKGFLSNIISKVIIKCCSCMSRPPSLLVPLWLQKLAYLLPILRTWLHHCLSGHPKPSLRQRLFQSNIELKTTGVKQSWTKI